MNRKTRQKIQNLSYILGLVMSGAYYLSITSLLNIANQSLSPAIITASIAIAFPQTVDILKLILGKAMGFSPSHFLKRYQTNHPIETKIYQLIASSIPNLHCLVDVIIKAPLKKEYIEIILEIIKEGLENTAIHSQAARADINLFVDHKKIKLFLQDDGQGFCIFSLTPQQQGLKKIERLAQRMGGTHRYETDESGTAHWIDIPLNNINTSPN